jgi:transcriptional regulator with XRE-family HTH domain
MLDMRLRVPELLKAHGFTTYSAAKRSGGRINYTTLYRVVRKRGQMKNFDAALLDALCDVLGIDPSELLERDKPPRRKAG